MATLLFYGLILLGPPAAVGVRAHRRGAPPRAVASRTALAAVGAFVLDVGILVLAFNGYTEDAGSPPSQTLVYAIPALLLGAALVLSAWLASGRR